MIIDSSALLAILYKEDDALCFLKAITTSSVCRMSAANFLEVTIRIDAAGDAETSRQLDHFIRQAAIEIAVVAPSQVQICCPTPK